MGDKAPCVVPIRWECTSSVSQTAAFKEGTGIAIQLRVMDVGEGAEVENFVLKLWMGSQQRPELLAGVVREQIGRLGNEVNEP